MIKTLSVLLLVLACGSAIAQNLGQELANGNFAKLDSKGWPEGWMCKCQSLETCKVEARPAGNRISIPPKCSLLSGVNVGANSSFLL